MFARKITGRNGEIIGFAVRGVEPSHFEDFVASLALDSDTAISMIHRDGTVIARYPKDDRLIGQNVADTPAFQRALALDGNVSGTLHQREIVGGQGRRGQVADALSDPDRRDHQDLDRARRLAGADQAAIFCGGAGGRRRDRHGLPDRAPAAPPACRRPAQALGEEPASRHRHQQHDAGPAAVRFLRAARDLQPAIYRHVRALDRRGQTRLPSARSDPASSGTAAPSSATSTPIVRGFSIPTAAWFRTP